LHVLRCGPVLGWRGKNADRVLEEIIRQASVPRFRFVSFCWHGGEPSLPGVEFYRRVVDLQYKYFWGLFRHRRCENIILTNGLLLKGALLDLLEMEKFVWVLVWTDQIWMPTTIVSAEGAATKSLIGHWAFFEN